MSSDTSSVSDHDFRLPTALAHKQLAQNIQRASTPDTEITEHPQHPDISILCDKCQSFVAVRLLQAHRSYHNALDKLEYRGPGNRPDTVKSLTKRRQHILRKITSKPPVSASAVQEVNEAYAILKAHLDDTFEDLILHSQEATPVECNGLALNCSAVCAHAVGICSEANERWKPSMEDTRVFQDYYGNDANKCFFAIYDGYSGRFAADISANDLHHYLLNEMSKFDSTTKCTCAINLAGYHDLADYKLDRPRPIVRKDSIRHIIHKESQNIIQQIMHTCEENIEQLKENDNINEARNSHSIEVNKITPSGSDVSSQTNLYQQNVEDAMRQAYRITDYVLSYGIDEVSRVRWSGCSAVTCIIHNLGPEEDEEENGDRELKDGNTEVDPDDSASVKSDGGNQRGMLYLANAGNCHAVLCRNGKAERLTKNHTLTNNYEKSRVRKAGASVQGDRKGYRVNGVLDTTRGLGNHGDPSLKAAVAAEPYATSVEINSETEFLILATQGIWEVLSDSEAVSLLEQMLPGRDVPPMTAPGEDDYLRMIKGHSKDQIADLVAGDLEQLGIDIKIEVDIPGQEGDIENGKQSNGGPVPPEGEVKKALSRPTSSSSQKAKESDLPKDSASRPTSSKSHKENGSNTKSKAGSNIEREIADVNASKEVLTEARSSENGVDGKQQLQESMESVPKTDGKDDLVEEIRVFPGSNHQEESSTVDGKEEKTYEDEENGVNRNEDNHSDVESEKSDDFESLISAIMENDDGNEADVETLTELQSIYAHSRLSGCPTRPEMYRSLAQAMCERLVQSALLAGSRDNITAMVILLPGCKL